LCCCNFLKNLKKIYYWMIFEVLLAISWDILSWVLYCVLM
jgi:hypothetical protein